MNITFKQGIIKYPVTGSTQSFLQQNGTGVNLLTDNGSTLITFTQGTSNYIFEEFDEITNAWIGPFVSNTNYWLYWDINTLTGKRTFGSTTLQPLISATQPTAPVTGQHWFDLSNNKMFVFETSIWRNVIRVFSAQYDGNGNFNSLGLGVGAFPFAGSQVGITNISDVAGKILFNVNDKPILTNTREFYTTESIFNVNGSNIDTLRLESLYTIVKAAETLPKYHVVSYISDGIVALAEYSSVNTVLGMITEDANLNDLSNIVLEGIITNIDWNFTEAIGTSIWVSTTGILVTSDPHLTDNVTNPNQYPPVARILSPNTIIFNPTYQFSDTENVSVDVNPATIAALGIVKLSTPPVNPLEPIVATDTDPRLSDPRVPLAHIHDALDVTFTSVSGLISTNTQNALDELNTNKADLAGATFTGPVILNGAPTTDLEAATKKYVDDLVNGLIWIDPIQFINVIGDTILTDPTTPNASDTYIIPASGSPAGNWATFTNNDIVQWDGTAWNLLDNLSSLTVARFGISLTSSTVPFGTFIGQSQTIGNYDTGTWTFETPIQNNATLVNRPLDFHSYHQFVYDTKWIEYAGPHSVLPGINLYQLQNTLNVKNVADGGTIDALTLDGNTKADFVEIAGDTMTGDLILNADPSVNLGAATKQYVDTRVLPNLVDVDSALAPIQGDHLYYDATASLWKTEQPNSGGGSPYSFLSLSICDRFDDTFWAVDSNMSWNGYQWIKPFTLNIGTIQAIGTWAAGYRPGSVNILVYSATATTVSIDIEDVNQTSIGSNSVSVLANTETVIPVAFSFNSDDIGFMNFLPTTNNELQIRCFDFVISSGPSR